METKEEFESVKKIVKEVLEANPIARDSDKHMIQLCLEKMGFIMFISNFNQLPSGIFETLRRTRQKTQEENPELRADEQIDEARQNKRKEVSNFMRNEPIENPSPFKAGHGVEVINTFNSRVHGIEVKERS